MTNEFEVMVISFGFGIDREYHPYVTVNESEPPFACDMTAIAPEQRTAHRMTIERLFGLVQSKRELPDGHSFELPNEPDILLTAAKFISLERLCCPFLGFGLEIEREGAPGGTVVVREDDAGNLSGQLRSGYVTTDENEEQIVVRAVEAVRELRQGSNSLHELPEAT